MRNPPSLNWFIAVLLLVLASLQLMQYRKTDGIGARLAKLETGHQDLQDAYLDGTRQRRAQLAQSLGYHAVPAPPHSSPTGRAMVGEAGTVIGGWGQSPAQAAQQVRQQREQLEKDFTSEPINPKWASDTTQAVDNLLQQSAAAGHTLRGAQVDCRSRTCRIKLDVGIGDNIDDLTQDLLTEMSSRLPSTKMLQQLSADGQGMELTFYASAPSH